MVIKSAKEQWEVIKSQNKRSSNQQMLRAYFRPDWIERVDFQVCDAAKYLEKYADLEGKDYTHIYSYNKVMSEKDSRGICEILNRTNFRILAWYFGPDKTRLSGLRHFELVH